MYIAVYLSLFWGGLLSAYVAAGRREAELTFTMFSILCWLGVTFSSGSVEVVSDGETVTFASNGLIVIGAAGTLVMFLYAFVVVTGRFPTSVDEYRDERKAEEGM